MQYIVNWVYIVTAQSLPVLAGDTEHLPETRDKEQHPGLEVSCTASCGTNADSDAVMKRVVMPADNECVGIGTTESAPT